jgi:integrase
LRAKAAKRTGGLPWAIEGPTELHARLTPAFCAKAAPIGKSVIYWDEQLPNFGLRVHASGARSWVIQYRAKGTTRRMTMNFVLPLEKARRQARVLLGAVAVGRDPLQEERAEAARAANTLEAVAEEYLRREGKKLRSLKRRRALFERLIFPALGARPIADIRRRDIVALLDDVDETNGPVMADHCWMVLRRLFSWHALRDEDFRTPLVRGMRGRHAAKRDRTLSDDEIRALWGATSEGKLFDRFVRFVLLTAVRRSEAAGMKRAELTNGTWTVPASRMKGGAEHVIPLSSDAQRLLAELPVIGSTDLLFTHDGKKAIAGFSKAKADLDARSGISNWTLHDLRRTARSLMSRGGVPSDHAERALAHALGGIRGVYDRHAFFNEKQHAFDVLAAQVRAIVDPPTGNVVVPMR